MISLATVEDLPRVTKLAAQFYTKLNPEGCFNPDAFVATYSSLLASGSAVILKRDKDGTVLEAIAAILYADPYDGALAAGFGFWFIAGDDDSLANDLLHHRLEQELRRRGVVRQFTTALIGERQLRVERFLKAAGYRAVEVGYRKDFK